ncbi:ABC transporter permease subunit [Pseudactinotalea sp. HY160]|uniref:amino acid ABC transporter permease n=1 Tax=Pseudactinotalea sp. HY160 TaxID=2654490 RepID=UPI00128B1772|nr:amino acid ABC transporter permease [Pseudactinotalea sp. HY160]MPV49880.1 ABC transporter permease subunit [Pseudactinotalea sp. HY160]
MTSQSVLFDAPGPRARRRQVYGNIVGALVVLGIGAYVIWQLADHGQFAGELWEPIFTARAWRFYFLPGLQNTVIAALYSVVLALVFGMLFGVGRLAANRALRWACGIIVEFFRAVPVLIMMIAAWFLLSGFDVIPSESAPMYAVIIGLTLYNGAVIAELVRSGVFGLPKGQREAGLAIGMTRGQSIRSIELPQALLAMLPALVSQFIIILKDSALGYIITYSELLRAARLLGSDAPYPILQTMFVAAVIFIVLNYVLSRIAEAIAGRIGRRTSGKSRAAGAAVEGNVTAPALGVGGREEEEPGR